MVWYYADGETPQGPVTEEEIRRLAAEGAIRPDTLVWHEGLSEWKPGSALLDPTFFSVLSDRVVGSGASVACTGCGRFFPESDMVFLGRSPYCETCVAAEPVAPGETDEDEGVFHFAGFWIRFVAVLIDGIVLSIVGFFVGLLASLPGAFVVGNSSGPESAAVGATSLLLAHLLNFIIGLSYDVVFVGRFGATPGKMACGLKIIRSDGRRVSYARALGRHFAEILSGLILMIGYIMAAFDEEKRALHDHLCDTRVIWKQG